MNNLQRPSTVPVAQVRSGPEQLLPLLGAYVIFIAVFWFLVVASPLMRSGLSESVSPSSNGGTTAIAAHPAMFSLSSLIQSQAGPKQDHSASGNAQLSGTAPIRMVSSTGQ